MNKIIVYNTTMNEEHKQIIKKFWCWHLLDGNNVPCPNDPRKGAKNSIHSSLKPMVLYGNVILACMDCGFMTGKIPQEILDADGSRYKQMVKDMNEKARGILLGTEPLQKPMFTEEQKKSVRDKILRKI